MAIRAETKLISTVFGRSKAATTLVELLNAVSEGNRIRAYITTKILETREVLDSLQAIKNKTIRLYLANILRDRVLGVIDEWGKKMIDKKIVTFAENVIATDFKQFFRENK